MISHHMDQTDATRQYGFVPSQLAVHQHTFMGEVSAPVQQDALPAGTIAAGWSTMRTDDPVISNNHGGEARMLAAPQFAYGSFAGRRGSFDWMAGKERPPSQQISPMVDRPSSVGPYG